MGIGPSVSISQCLGAREAEGSKGKEMFCLTFLFCSGVAEGKIKISE